LFSMNFASSLIFVDNMNRRFHKIKLKSFKQLLLNDGNFLCLFDRCPHFISLPNRTLVSVKELSEMKVTELKDELRKRGLPISGPKSKLIERIKAEDKMTFVIEEPRNMRANNPHVDIGKPI